MDIDLWPLASKSERENAQERARVEGIQAGVALVDILASHAAEDGFTLDDLLATRKSIFAEASALRGKMKRVDGSPWLAWFDGASEPNPGESSIGGLLVGPDGEIHEISTRVGYGTNNFAEYSALIAVLEAAVERQVTNIVIHGDSKLVVCQVNGDWDVNSLALRPLCDKAFWLLAKIPRSSLKWIPREKNEAADALSKKALDGVTRPSPRNADSAQWGNQTRIGQILGVSSVAIGRMLNARGLRSGRKPTQQALDAGLAKIVDTSFGSDVFWHAEKTSRALREQATSLDSTAANAASIISSATGSSGKSSSRRDADA